MSSPTERSRGGSGGCASRLPAGRSGQNTVEAAFALPVLMLLCLMLLQPGIIAYDRIVMGHAAAEGCRLLATAEGSVGDDRLEALVRRRLGAIPPVDAFHIHEGGCTWKIEFERGDGASGVGVRIETRLRLLPGFSQAAALMGAGEGDGAIAVSVEERLPAQPAWVARSLATPDGR